MPGYVWQGQIMNRLMALNILPSSIFIELLFLRAFQNVNYAVETQSPLRIKQCDKQYSNKLEFRSTRLKKSDENFWVRSSKLQNIFQKILANMEINKKLLTILFIDYVRRCYNERDSCTWRILSFCGKMIFEGSNSTCGLTKCVYCYYIISAKTFLQYDEAMS